MNGSLEGLENLTSTARVTDDLGVTLDCPRFEEEDMALLIGFTFWVEGVLQTVLASLGIVGNFVSIFVLTRKSMRNAFNLLLVTLGEFDILLKFATFFRM